MIDFAYAADGAVAANQSPWSALLMWLPLFAIIYFMMIRPNQKREKARQTMISELKKGDRVLLAAGFYGRVIKTGEHVFTIELARGVNIEVDRNAIAAKVDANANPVEPEAANSQPPAAN